MSVTVDMPVHEDHLSEYLEQHICACFSASKLLVQALDIVNFDSFDILHQDGPLRTLKDIYFRNVKVITVLDVAEVVDCLLRVNHLCLEIELLAETLLEVIEEFVEVNALVVVVEAGFIGHLCQSPDNEQIKFGLNP